MKFTRRIAFATPFVAIACGSGYRSGPNPPHPGPHMTVAQCEAVAAGSVCAEAERCDIPREDGCGHVGWHCDNGGWRETLNLCNPPPPVGEQVPAPTDASPTTQSQ
jgi:hypothetical protein